MPPPEQRETPPSGSSVKAARESGVGRRRRRLFVGGLLLIKIVAVVAVLSSSSGGLPWFDEPPADRESDAVPEGGVDASIRPVALRRNRMAYAAKLSDYQLFDGPMSALTPAEGVVEYQLNTPLFTDYAEKQRLIKLPPGTAAGYTAIGPLDFPVGTIIAKTFLYPADARAADGGRQLVETRILEHRDDGWVGIPYLWNAEQTDAVLALTGGEVAVSWVHTDGERRENVHLVPNFNDCKRCHATPTMQPIGPKAGNLNLDLAGSVNQLMAWSVMGMLTGMPEHEEVPRLADWDDPSTGTVDERARAYLDVNCAHCHSEQGPARNSGLHLNVAEADPYRLGVLKTPVAAGRGTGGRLYGIVPGKPHESIMHYRVETTKAGEMMPEFGRSLVHEEGLALLTEWIEGME